MDDRELLESYYLDKDNKWLGILLTRYTMLLLGVCMKYLKDEDEARDAVQQVFLKVITEVPKQRIHYFKSWLYIVTKNVCLMRLRVKNLHIPIELVEHKEVTDASASITEHREKEKIHELLIRSLDMLNAEQKQCVSLFYLNKKTYQEISQSTGFSLLQVKSYIQNGKRNLKLLMERKMND